MLHVQDFDEVFLFEFFYALFIINDADFSGTMDLDEFIETLSSLGRPKFDQEAAKRFMSEYDKDESGSIDANEFG
jgi:Ca2+-binding EF-hand superfamily protein